MSLWRATRSGLRRLLNRGAADRDLDDELRHYVAMATEDNLRKGMTPDAAARAARVQVGSAESAKEEVRSFGWNGAVDSLRQDIRLAVRGLRRSPGFALTAIISLALGIGALTAMFSIVNAVIWRPLPYRDADRLALVWTNDPRRGLPREPTAYLTITDWQSQTRAFEELAYFSMQRVAPMSNDPGGGRGRSRSALVSANLFHVLGVTPFKGRLLSADDERERAPVAVISFGFWQRWFGGAEDIIGKTIAIDDSSKGGLGTLTIVGVLPRAFYFPDRQTELYTPATTYWRFTRESTERFPDWARRWTAVGRLANGASLADAHKDLERIGQQLTAAHPSSVPDFPGFLTTVMPVLDSIAGTRLQASLWMLLGAVIAVLLVVCANVANLQLARGATRQREFAVQRALGASRGRLVRQVLVESVALVLTGGAIGAAVAIWTTPALASAISAYVPRMDEVTLDARVLLLTVVSSLSAGVVFGLIPAIRVSSPTATEALRESGRTTGSRRSRRSQSVLVLAECTLALVLLMGAGLLLKSWHRLHGVEPGFDTSNVLTLRLEFPSEPPPSAEERLQTSNIAPARAASRNQQIQDTLERVSRIPGTSSVSVTDDLFVAGQGNSSITIPGRPADQSPAGELNDAAVTASFFETMGVPLRAGRYPTPDDAVRKIRALWSPLLTHLSLEEKERRAVPEPVVVNEAFVARYFASEDPIGKRFCIDPTNKTYWYEIVGVVGDMHRGGLERAAMPEYYGPFIPSPGGRADLLIRTSGDPLVMAPAIRAEVARALPLVRIDNVSTADAQMGGFTAQRRLQTWLLASFALLAVGLAAIGIFGLTHYAVAERTQEIGIRAALGATPGRILRLLVVEGMRMPIVGVIAGLAASFGLTQLIASQLYDVRATDPATFVVVAVTLTVVAGGACAVAAWRAARTNPVGALRRTG